MFLYIFTAIQGLEVLIYTLTDLKPEVFTLEHEDFIFIALLCTTFIRDAILQSKSD